jgi:hypothetical protein
MIYVQKIEMLFTKMCSQKPNPHTLFAQCEVTFYRKIYEMNDGNDVFLSFKKCAKVKIVRKLRNKHCFFKKF